MTTPPSVPEGPGPLIWVVILIAAVSGAIWGLGVAVAVGVATTAIFVLVGLGLQSSINRKRAREASDVADAVDVVREIVGGTAEGPASVSGGHGGSRMTENEEDFKWEASAPPNVRTMAGCHWCKVGEVRDALPKAVLSWILVMDGKVPDGPFNKHVLSPVRSAWHKYREISARLVKPVGDRVASLQVDGSRIVVSSLPYEFGGAVRGVGGAAELLGALLQCGTKSNVERLLIGRDWCGPGDVDNRARRWEKVVSELGDQGVIDTALREVLGLCWFAWAQVLAMVEKVHRSVQGYYIVHDDPLNVSIAGRVLSGIAFPAMAVSRAKLTGLIGGDLRATKKLVEERDEEVRLCLERVRYEFTDRKVDVAVPISLDGRFAAKWIDEMLWYACMRPAVESVMDLMSSPDVFLMIKKKFPGDMENIVLPWVGALALGPRLEESPRDLLGQFCACCLRSSGG